MKKLFFLFFSAILLISPAAAHPGRLDAAGGHYDRTNASGLGPYHYHHGYSAHLHTNGVCPYSSGSSSSSNSSSSSGSSNIVTISSRYDDGYNDGYNDGYSHGYTDGHTDGYNEGYEENLSDYDDGYNAGVADTITEKQAEINQAFQDGMQSGIDGRNSYYTKLHKKYTTYIYIAGAVILIVLIYLITRIHKLYMHLDEMYKQKMQAISENEKSRAEIKRLSDENAFWIIENQNLEQQLAAQTTVGTSYTQPSINN